MACSSRHLKLSKSGIFFHHLIQAKIKKTLKFLITGVCERNPRGVDRWIDSPHKGSVMRNTFSCQICKIAGCACAGNAGNVSPRRRIQRKLLVSDPGMHHGTCVTHVPWCMSGSLTHGGGENVPGIPGACASAILCIWQEAHTVIIFSISAVCGVFLLAFGGALGMVRASRSFHKALLSTVLKLPMSFFDTTPKGRILNRFSKDVDSLDDQVRTLTIILLFQLCAMCATIAAICYTTPWFTALAVILVCLFLSLQVMRYHDDVSKWKHFMRYWPFVRGIHQSPVVPLTKASDVELWCFLWSAPEQTLNKKSRR